MNKREDAVAFVADIVRDFPTEDTPQGKLSGVDRDTLVATLFLKFREHGMLKVPVGPFAMSAWGNAVSRAWRDYPPVEDDIFAEGWVQILDVADLISLD